MKQIWLFVLIVGTLSASSSGLFSIKAIKKEYQRIQKHSDNYEKHQFKVNDFSEGGGRCEYFLYHKRIKKLSCSWWGEGDSEEYRFFFKNNHMFFAYTKYIQNDVRSYGKENASLEKIFENRFYFIKDRLIRWVEGKKIISNHSKKFKQKKTDLIKNHYNILIEKVKKDMKKHRAIKHMQRINDPKNYEDVIILRDGRKQCKIMISKSSRGYYETTCAKRMSENAENILCIPQSRVCKPLGQISYFNLTGASLPRKIGTNLPLIGKRTFDFGGGRDTERYITGYEYGYIEYGHVGSDNAEYLGKYNSSNNPYRIIGNVICTLEYGNINICTELRIPYDNQPVETTLSQKKICAGAEQLFVKKAEAHKAELLDPDATTYAINQKAYAARDAGLEFIKQCRNVPRNIFWKGGYRIEDVEDFVRRVNEVQRINRGW